MTTNERDIDETSSPELDSDGGDTETNIGVDTEFKITVRKLDLPVRPRGVLAE